MPQPAEVDAAAQRLADLYETAQRDLEDQLAAILDDESTVRQQARLRRLITSTQATAERLRQGTGDWLTGTLPELHALGAQFAAEALGAADFAWTQPHLYAVQQLATTTFDDVAVHLQDMAAETRRTLRGWASDATRQALLESRTAVQAGRDIRKVASEQGLFTVTYRNGAQHAMADYADTVARTTSAVAYNDGSVVQCREEGIEYIEYADGPDCGVTSHDDPVKANGLIVHIDEVVSISHPRCRRAILPAPDAQSIPGVDASIGPQRPPEPAPLQRAQRAREARTSRLGRQQRQPRTA